VWWAVTGEKAMTGKETMTREEILTAMRVAAKKLGRSPYLEELAPVTRKAVRKIFNNYSKALKEAGMETHRRVPMETLFLDWAAIVRQMQKLPNSVEYQKKGAYSAKALQKRCGGWKRVSPTMLRFALEKDLEKQWSDVVALARAERELVGPATESLWPGHETARWDVFTNRPVYGTPMNICPLAHAPANEIGVIFLFGVMIRDLGYVVTLLQAEFPDCEALRQVKQDRWQRVRIEFEFESLNFVKHGHDVKGCDMIICWKHNWPECPLEVLELRKEVGKLLPLISGGQQKLLPQTGADER
jgi:hypothetical protein